MLNPLSSSQSHPLIQPSAQRKIEEKHKNSDKVSFQQDRFVNRSKARFGSDVEQKGFFTKLKGSLSQFWNKVLTFFGIASKEKGGDAVASVSSSSSDSSPLVPDHASGTDASDKEENTITPAEVEHKKKKLAHQQQVTKFQEIWQRISSRIFPAMLGEEPLDEIAFKRYTKQLSEAAKGYFQEHKTYKQYLQTFKNSQGVNIDDDLKALEQDEKQLSRFNIPPDALERIFKNEIKASSEIYPPLKAEFTAKKAEIEARLVNDAETAEEELEMLRASIAQRWNELMDK